MTKVAQTHYCKWCRGTFVFVVDELETGNRLLECPGEMCGRTHPRYFKDGIAEVCELLAIGGPPIRIKGRRTVPVGMRLER